MSRSLFILFIISYSVKAQLILTQANNAPVPAYSYSFMYYDSVVAIPKTTGLNKLWDFSSFYPTGSDQKNTYTISAASPSANLFPSANLVCGVLSGGTSFGFWNSQNAFLEYDGNIEMIGSIKTVYSDKLSWMVWPFTFGSSTNDSFASTTTYSASNTYSTFGNTAISATGTGTLMTPNWKIYPNCLQTIRTSTYAGTGSSNNYTVELRSYEYWHGSYRSPVITIQYETYISSIDTTKDVDIFVNALADVGIDENELIANGFVMYPNPTKEKLNVLLKDNSIAEEIKLFDAIGKLILSEKNTNTLDVLSLPKGIYIAKVKSKNLQLQKQVIITE